MDNLTTWTLSKTTKISSPLGHGTLPALGFDVVYSSRHEFLSCRVGLISNKERGHLPSKLSCYYCISGHISPDRFTLWYTESSRLWSISQHYEFCPAERKTPSQSNLISLCSTTKVCDVFNNEIVWWSTEGIDNCMSPFGYSWYLSDQSFIVR